MKTFRCIKTVTAARIVAVANMAPSPRDPLGQTVELTLDDNTKVQVLGEQYDHARPGCYFVREFDGETSVVTATVFERWHAPSISVEQSLADTLAPLPASQHEKMEALSLQIEAERRTRREDFDYYERHKNNGRKS